jgi:sterol desaturase/sphingolipid hydroxylase (fatty acid hydroxylase superfamily)
MKNPFIDTLIFFSKIAISCLLLQVFLEKYLDFNKFPPAYYPLLHWFSNFMIYYPFSFFMLYLKNSNYFENRKAKHQLLTKKWPKFEFKGIVYGEAIFFIVCNIYNTFFPISLSKGNIFQKLGWFYLCIYASDILFFVTHYTLHEKFFWIHKRHHKEVDTNGFSSEIKSLYESMITTLMDLMVFVVLGRDMNQFVAWIVIGVLYNVEGHSSIKMFYITTDFHVNHHLYFECNFGIGFYLDYLFGTSFEQKEKQFNKENGIMMHLKEKEKLME